MIVKLVVQQALLKHFLAAIAYRTPHELIWHMTGLVGYARTHFLGGVWQPEKLPTFDQEIRRFHDVLEDLGRLLDEKPLREISAEQLLQGALADTMTHVGQLAMLRRLASSPVLRKISFARRPPRPTWDQISPDLPPPAPGKGVPPGW
jgi:hypothetical protein